MKKQIWDCIFILTGGMIWAFGLNTFLIPNAIAAGGITGLAAAFCQFVPVSVGTLIILLNLPIFLFSIVKRGMGFSVRTFLVLCVTSVLIDVSGIFMPVFSEDKLFAAIIGGVLCGVGLGLIFMRGFATGGTDLLASLISDRLPTVSYGRLVLMLDAVVVLIAAFCYRDWRSGLYSALTVYVSGEVIDKVLSGATTGKSVYIISEKHAEISAAILERMQRGVTLLDGEGGFSRRRMPVLMTVVRKYELYRIKNIVTEYDREAFVTVGDVTEILGRGFSLDGRA